VTGSAPLDVGSEADPGAGPWPSAWRSFIRRQSAWGLEQSGDFEGAERVLNEAFVECPDDAEVVIDLCGLLLRRGRRREAVALLAAAQLRSPCEAGRLAIRLAMLQGELGDPRTALSWYARALSQVAEPSRELLADRVEQLRSLLDRTAAR
jgi:Flp pilus assembly protein TadD